MSDTLPLGTRRVDMTIGWTKNTEQDRAEGYVSFFDGYEDGRAQETVSLTLTVPDDVTGGDLAEAVFHATNCPEDPCPDTLAGQILAGIQETGYRGEGAHFSLSVGDTVTVDGVRYCCESLGWEAR